MKSIKLIAVIILSGLIFTTACKKNTDGPLGDKKISGQVTYKRGDGATSPASSALVQIAYGTTSASTSFDQTILADGNGNYTLQGLAKGDYYITASFTDDHGFKYSCPGYSVEIKNTKDDITINLVCE